MKGTQLWRLPIGTVFEDFYGQQRFVKEGELSNDGPVTIRSIEGVKVRPKQKFHKLRCLHSPFTKTKPPGPISSAFFCAVDDVIYREGSLRVFPLEQPAKKLECA